MHITDTQPLPLVPSILRLSFVTVTADLRHAQRPLTRAFQEAFRK